MAQIVRVKLFSPLVVAAKVQPQMCRKVSVLLW
jgi:hypothetical protein